MIELVTGLSINATQKRSAHTTADTLVIGRVVYGKQAFARLGHAVRMAQ